MNASFQGRFGSIKLA